MGFARWGFCVWLVVVSTPPVCTGITDPRDVGALNSLYISLGFPPLLGWLPYGGDPCGDEWQGVRCVFANITSLILNGMNLGGVLGDDLDFASILVIDLSNNQIGGSIPPTLPVTIRNFSLSGNQFSGSIPGGLSSLSQLTDLSLGNNHLSGGIPDAFQQLTGLTTMDMSGNSLSGQLPPSMGSLSYLRTLNLQNNKLTGTLDVLQDLNLMTLNIENNLFSGPIPEKLLIVPDFRKDGNPFNTTNIASPPAFPPLAAAPSPIVASPKQADGPRKQSDESSSPDTTKSAVVKNFWSTKIVILIAVSGVVILIAMGICLLVLSCCKGREVKKTPNEKPNYNVSSLQSNYQVDKERERTTRSHLSSSSNSSCGPTVFSVASLQQYTNSFAVHNFIGEGIIGRVYRAELPDGKILAVKKLGGAVTVLQSDAEFLELVSTIFKLKHANLVELVGYCNEHGQRLLVYEYCRNGTLQDALHIDHEIHQKLSWNVRVRVALGAASALQYLHEVCQPPVIHRNFKSANILLGNKLAVHVSDCGLSPLVSSGFANQVISCCYNAPELELGSYTCQSDVYSLGVVMLELLTGRKSYDRLRPRGEQSLVRWAIPQLHDIDALSRMVDPSLNGAYPAKSLSRFADIISRCVQWEPGFRPPISEIVQDLLHMI
ncbi:Pkinase_Tyr domain-containing protein/LRRNT_2 domain-containing protein/LRR_8 domain-containing protein [Cephalotus follicularis]|uniref:Pkinase_Tyr domain-containing protein/LRRNT_2 domain-containing protein/LRR_8 domain-containing protein n=1 Tax=Cephalotus follicularis TaxID=3775 RepID=A0A1Q3AUD1_CEPFO|nr:Pkinase_Tyr domain-containing protein/LRRNT_2 domain-containing protein/LRR_8 domain-containing protein [Cephalotus follicularis]